MMLVPVSTTCVQSHRFFCLFMHNVFSSNYVMFELEGCCLMTSFLYCCPCFSFSVYQPTKKTPSE